MHQDSEPKRHIMVRLRVVISAFLVGWAINSMALAPCTVLSNWYKAVDYAPIIKTAVWNGRIEESLDYARRTGYLVLWLVGSRQDGMEYSMEKFVSQNIGRQAFCNIINNYGNIILCYSEYSLVKKLKDQIYGYTNINMNGRGTAPNGYHVWHSGCGDGGGWADPPPCLHLLRVDSSTNILFHIACEQKSLGHARYEGKFSPYASQIPTTSRMLYATDAFAVFFKKYLDMFPTVKTTTVPNNAEDGWHTFVLHRENIVFRKNLQISDILVKEALSDTWSPDEDISCTLENADWFVDHDDTINITRFETSGISTPTIQIMCESTNSHTIGLCADSDIRIDTYATHIYTNVVSSIVAGGDMNEYAVVDTNVVAVNDVVIGSTNLQAYSSHHFIIEPNKNYYMCLGSKTKIFEFEKLE